MLARGGIHQLKRCFAAEASVSQAPTKLKRFWKKTEIAETPEGYKIQLDKRNLKTPDGKEIVLQNKLLALMTAQEWETQNKIVKSYSLPITSIINRSMEMDSQREHVINSLLAFVHTDSICYQQDYPSSFVELQQKYWQPLIEYIEQAYNLKINITNGILRIKQDEETVNKFREIISNYSDLELAVFEKAVTRTKSFMIGLCLLDRQVDADFGYRAGSLEVIHQIEKWGEVEDSHDTDREEMKRCLAACLVCLMK